MNTCIIIQYFRLDWIGNMMIETWFLLLKQVTQSWYIFVVGFFSVRVKFNLTVAQLKNFEFYYFFSCLYYAFQGDRCTVCFKCFRYVIPLNILRQKISSCFISRVSCMTDVYDSKVNDEHKTTTKSIALKYKGSLNETLGSRKKKCF